MKLLRRIRQGLMDKGKIKRYLVYAISETFLVMLGILLALYVSNWNQNAIQERKEKKALEDLYKEFKLNRERINQKQLSRTSMAPKLAKYIKEVTSGKADYHSFEEFHAKQFVFGMTNPSDGVINALISSGEIALISNDSLKYLIADWKNQTENLYENEQILWKSGLKYIDCYASSIPIPTHNWQDWNDEKLERAFEGLTSSVEYKNNLVGFEGVNTIVIAECNSILILLGNILSILEDEINKKTLGFTITKSD